MEVQIPSEIFQMYLYLSIKKYISKNFLMLYFLVIRAAFVMYLLENKVHLIYTSIYSKTIIKLKFITEIPHNKCFLSVAL